MSETNKPSPLRDERQPVARESQTLAELRDRWRWAASLTTSTEAASAQQCGWEQCADELEPFIAREAALIKAGEALAKLAREVVNNRRLKATACL